MLLCLIYEQDLPYLGRFFASMSFAIELFNIFAWNFQNHLKIYFQKFDQMF